jgi:hypothetical protein
MRHLTPEHAEAIHKVMFGWEKHLKTKNQTLSAVELELKNVTEVVRRDPTLRVFVKRIAMSVSLDSIKVIYFYLILAFFIFNSKFFLLRLNSACSGNVRCRGERHAGPEPI